MESVKGFQKLDVYTENPDGNTYTKVDSNNEYYRRTYEQNKDVLPFKYFFNFFNNLFCV